MRLFDAALDATVLFSFDRTGFRRHARAFDPVDLAVDLSGKTMLVTGANTGLGLATVKTLTKLGATVVMACRDLKRGNAARAGVQGNTELLQLDLSSLAEVERFVKAWGSRPLDVLINNAGVLPTERQTTAEGVELAYATNIVGPVALTEGVLPVLRSSRGRVVTVSSGGMYPVKLDVQALRGEVKKYDGVAAYAQSKRAQVILNELWADREPLVTFAAMHPGWADTAGVKASIPTFHRITQSILRSVEEGADTIVWLAACARVAGQSGKFWFDRAPAPTHAFPWTHERPEDRSFEVISPRPRFG
ncbi:MAG: SDR family NAD(P)-dependent oxidoreductase [Archangium sp.]|nr:SDR family NAD(P)-dependent oxidoreductase [Archangium sp.]MDP3157388.1 SDR family NAD(P)-dependent oxidoreductase [Archangium sp.]MDP3571226.1 SDR family NAD(P)-dependent oxidoreductase [Archangium sp.]